MLGQMLDAGAVTAAVAGPLRTLGDRAAEVGHVLDRDDDVDLERLADAGVDDRDRARRVGRRRSPPRKRATSSSGRWVADSPMRCGGRAVISSSRSSESARWAPRLVAAMAWISSTITVSTPTSVSAADDVSIR